MRRDHLSFSFYFLVFNPRDFNTGGYKEIYKKNNNNTWDNVCAVVTHNNNVIAKQLLLCWYEISISQLIT